MGLGTLLLMLLKRVGWVPQFSTTTRCSRRKSCAAENLALAFILGVQADLQDAERIIHRARRVARFPEADRAIGDDDDAPSALGELELAGIAQRPRQRLRRADAPDARHVLQRVHQFLWRFVLFWNERQQFVARVGGPAIDVESRAVLTAPSGDREAGNLLDVLRRPRGKHRRRGDIARTLLPIRIMLNIYL